MSDIDYKSAYDNYKEYLKNKNVKYEKYLIFYLSNYFNNLTDNDTFIRDIDEENNFLMTSSKDKNLKIKLDRSHYINLNTKYKNIQNKLDNILYNISELINNDNEISGISSTFEMYKKDYINIKKQLSQIESIFSYQKKILSEMDQKKFSLL